MGQRAVYKLKNFLQKGFSAFAREGKAFPPGHLQRQGGYDDRRGAAGKIKPHGAGGVLPHLEDYRIASDGRCFSYLFFSENPFGDPFRHDVGHRHLGQADPPRDFDAGQGVPAGHGLEHQPRLRLRRWVLLKPCRCFMNVRPLKFHLVY